MDKALLTLPLAIQIALGSGYLAYLIAYAGLREKHTSTDAVFRTIAFGLIATAVLTWLDANSRLIQLSAFGATVLAGAFWRFKGMDWTRRVLRKSDISWTDDVPTAWLTVTATRTSAAVAHIAVDLDDGRTVVCDDTRPFADAPYGPCVFGLAGDVALYVTAERRPDGEWFDHLDILHPTEGARLTYLPVGKIKRVELRFWTKANALAAAAEMEAEQAAAGAPEGALNLGYRSGAASSSNLPSA